MTILPVKTEIQLSLGDDEKALYEEINASTAKCVEASASFVSKDYIVDGIEKEEIVRKLAKKVSATGKQVKEKRLTITRVIDTTKTLLMVNEKEILFIENVLRAKLTDWENEKRQKERQSLYDIAKEKEYSIFVENYKAETIVLVTNFADKMASDTEATLNKKICSTDIEELKILLNRLKAVKLKVKESSYEKLFNNEKQIIQVKGFQDFDPIEIDLSEVNKELKETYSLNVISDEYEYKMSETIKKFKKLITDRINILEETTLLEEKERQAFKKELEEKAQEEALAAKEKRKKEAQAQAQELERTKIENQLNAEVNAAIQSQTRPESKGKGTRLVTKAQVVQKTAYTDLIAFYIANGGNIDKLSFLADFAAKNGKPTIQGVTYTEQAKASLR